MLYKFCWLICWLILKVIFRLEVEGSNNIPRKESVMLVANHISFLDPPAIGVAIKRPLVFFARKDLFSIPFFRLLLWGLDTIPISRDKLEFSLFKKFSKLVDRNKAFVIFPEGTRSKTGEIQPGKPGVGFIAWKTRVKIIPAFIKGTNKALPLKAKFIRPAKIKIVFGQPLDLSNFYRQNPSKELFQKIIDRIMQAIRELKT